METKGNVKKKNTIFLNEKMANELMEQYNNGLKKIVEQYSKECYIVNNCLKIQFEIGKKIIKYNNHIWCPPLDTKLKKINNNTWFDITESERNNNNINFNDVFIFDEIGNIQVKAKKILLKLTLLQKRIIKYWMFAYTEMYNKTLKYIKDIYETTGKVKTNWKKIRASLTDEKAEIIAKYLVNGNKKLGIKVHDIDFAIKECCKNYSAALTNFKRGNIKTFRMRYWGKSKPTKIVDLEVLDFASGSIRKNVLGEIKGYYNSNEFDFSTIDHDCRLQYNVKKDEYVLLVPVDVETKHYEERDKFISLDPGLREFLTGVSDNKVTEIGHNCTKKIENLIMRKEKIMKNQNIDKSIKKKNEKNINKKISNLVDELHWKTINHLTKNYKNIFIGNMSPKKIISNQNKVKFSPTTKKVISSLRFFEFRQRLKYKCEITETNYKCVNEKYTSMICSNCGNVKHNLGGNKKYHCNKCNIVLGRDINSCRDMYIISIQ